MSAPRLARLLLHVFVPAARRDDALGDLEETWRRRRHTGRARAWLASLGEAAVIAAVEIGERVRSVDLRRLPAASSDLRLAARLMRRQPLVTITATIALEPALTPGFQMKVYLNGAEYKDWPSGALTYSIQNLFRGSYTLQARVVDDSGKAACMGPMISFHVRQPTINSPARRPTPTPN